MGREISLEHWTELTNEIHDTLGCTEELTREIISVALSDIVLFDKKQHDRGPGNIAMFGAKGIVVRLQDKFSRIYRIVWDEKAPKVSEPVENEFADTSIYGMIARVVMRDKWK